MWHNLAKKFYEVGCPALTPRLGKIKDHEMNKKGVITVGTYSSYEFLYDMKFIQLV